MNTMVQTKIALVQPRINAGTSLGIEKSPESIQSLAGQLEREGYEAHMFHEPANDKLYHQLTEMNPTIVGISTMTANILDGIKVAQTVKKINPSTLVIIGGWHASGVVHAHLKNQESESIREMLYPGSPIDYIVAGEGDIVFPEIVRRVSSGKTIKDLQGVCYVNDTEIIASVADRVRNLDDLASPSWERLPINDYRDKRSGNLDLSVHFNRACRYSCGYCSTPTVYGKGVETVSAERAANIVESVLERFNPNVMTITDEDFFANLPWVKEIVRIFTERDLTRKYNVSFDTFASINDLHRLEERGEEVFLDQMHKAGFSSFTIGIESLNPEVLKSYNKELMILPTMTKLQREKYRQSSREEQNQMLVAHYFNCAQRAIRFANKHGILVVGDYIIGNLGENEQQVRIAFEKFTRLQELHIAYIPIYTPFPGTKLWKEAYDSGKLVRTREGRIDWSRFNASAGALNLGYNVEELRNQLELDFYTSQRYQRDMGVEIERRPELIGLFRGRFNYLNRIMPGNETVETIIKKLN
ncbi:MAG: radical SAM protein [Candidatus Woesearchaeota archaeon]|jgi:anaerobic magnesium-protoporphyrin IX monomethyl ester cyclase